MLVELVPLVLVPPLLLEPLAVHAVARADHAAVAAQGLAQISDAGALDRVVDEVLTRNPEEVAAFRGGKAKLMGFFVGEVMKATRGQANPKTVNEILNKKLRF